MPRRPREISETGFYHVTVRGTGRQLIFEDDSDRFAFLRIMSRAFNERGVGIIAWCLMDNHVHLVVRDEFQALSDAMRAGLSRYAARFNGRSGHVGHVFQDRFASFAIEDDPYLLEAVRYVHDNPAKAGICAAEEYPWSSYHEYVGASEFADTGLVLEMLGGREGFERFHAARPSLAYPPGRAGKLAEGELLARAREALGGLEPAEVKALARGERDGKLRALRCAGLSVRQIERATGVGRSTIERVCAAKS